MRWIGQYIYDNISRFRDDVYLENLSTTTETSALVIDSNGKVSKNVTSGVNMTNGADNRVVTAVGTNGLQAEPEFLYEMDSDISTLSILSNQDNGDFFSIATTTHGATTLTTVDDDAAAANFEIAADGDITLDSAGQIKLEPAAGNNILLDGTVAVDAGAVSGLTSLTCTGANLEIFAFGNSVITSTNDFTIFSATSEKPLVEIKSTTNDDKGSTLQFTSDKGGAGADGDKIGTILFVGDDDAQNQHSFAKIVGSVSESANGSESGKLEFFVSESDGEAPALTAGLTIEGEHNVDGEIDVTIAAGAASLTTIAGDLTVTGSDLTFDSVALTAIQTSGETFADNDTSLMTSAAIDDRINAADTSVHATVQTGKNYRILNCSFRDDIGTTKHYLPFKSQDEQTVLTREEVSELAVMDGRVVSVTLRVENLNTHSGDATVTFGVETNVVGTGYDNFTEIETEAITVNNADDSHLYHAVFSTAKHWDSTDMFAISITSDTDISGSNERFFVTVVVEDDWSTYLAGSTREIDSTP